jgi:hypothetical protein
MHNVMTEPPVASESYTPRTVFGKALLALRQAAVEEAKRRGEPLLES